MIINLYPCFSSGVYLHIKTLKCGCAKTEEIRRHILDFSKSGKFKNILIRYWLDYTTCSVENMMNIYDQYSTFENVSSLMFICLTFFWQKMRIPEKMNHKLTLKWSMELSNPFRYHLISLAYEISSSILEKIYWFLCCFQAIPDAVLSTTIMILWC